MSQAKYKKVMKEVRERLDDVEAAEDAKVAERILVSIAMKVLMQLCCRKSAEYKTELLDELSDLLDVTTFI